MRPLKTSLIFLTSIIPATAFAQEAVTLDEIPESSPAPAPAPAPAAEPAAPAAAAGGTVALDEQPAASASYGASAGTTAAAPAAAAPPPPPPAAEAPAEEPARPSAPRTRGGGPETGTWEFGYAGYFRAPMRMGFGKTGGPQNMYDSGLVDGNGDTIFANTEGKVPQYYREQDPTTGNLTDPVMVTDANGQPVYMDQRTSVHYPIIPDDQYASWQFSPHNKKDWAEMFFSVGNGIVSGTLAIQAFQFTDASWKQDNSQFGIGQGWVEVNHDLGFENIKFNAKVGSHWNRYGNAGVYDSGEYDTYIIARTHVMGGTARVDVDLGGLSVGMEGGVGTNRPDPEMYNRARFTTLLHGHAFIDMPTVNIGLHGLHAFSAAEVVPHYPQVKPGSNCGYEGGTDGESPGVQCVTDADDFNGGVIGVNSAGMEPGSVMPVGVNSVFGQEFPNGSQTVVGVDAKFNLGMAGYLFLGYSHQFLSNALTVGDAIESIHSLGAGEFNIGVVDNYLESPFCPADAYPTQPAPNGSCSGGNGNIGSAMLQYELGLANFGVFQGNQDLKFKLYGMVNFVSVSDDEILHLQPVLANNAAAQAEGITMDDIRQNGTVKLKGGIDAEFYALEWLSAGLRFDHLSPHSKISEQAFSILSPRVTFRSQMVTHEQISLQYSHYFYAQRQCVERNAAGDVVGYASPADDPYRVTGSIYNNVGTSYNGLALNAYCAQPAAAASEPNGFGSHSTNQSPGTRGAPNLLPDENVIKLEASIWW